jgi:hypothetical protein
MELPPSDPIADAKDRLREEGIVTGPDRWGNWFVPTGKDNISGWQPGDDINERVLVRNSGVVANFGRYNMRWGWVEGRWIENVEGWSERVPDGTPLPQIY